MFKKLKESWAKAKAEADFDAATEKSMAAKAAAGLVVLRGADMPALAQEFLELCVRKNIPLDTTSKTLAILDRFIAGARGVHLRQAAEKHTDAREAFDMNCCWVGAYLGEVIRRETGGSWVDVDGSPMLDLGKDRVTPMHAAAQLLSEGRIKSGDAEIPSADLYFALVCRLQQNWLDRVAIGSYESMAALRASMADGNEEMISYLIAQSQIAVLTAKLKWNTDLDFSPESVKAVERILGALHDASKAAPADQQPNEAQIDGAVKVWGIYAGEVFRRQWGGRWQFDDQAGVLSVHVGEATIWPLAKTRKRLVDGDGDNVAFYLHATGQILSGAVKLPDR